MTENAPRPLFPKELTPTVIYEDTHLIVLSKPAGLLSQGELSGDLNLVDWLRQHFGRHYVGLVHRLDRNTSGIMVAAKRTKSANRLTEALQAGTLERGYLGWVENRLPHEARWMHWLVKDSERNTVRVVGAGASGKPKNPDAKSAAMTAKPLQHSTRHGHPITLVEFKLETGRSHQIRAQSAHAGHPLLGDRKYGARIDFPRTALHSHWISFPHPMSGETLRWESPLPEDVANPTAT